MNDYQAYLVDAFSLGGAVFLIYWLFLKSKAIQNWFQKNFAHESGQMTHWMVSKYLAFVLMGGVCGLFVLTQHPIGDVDALGIGVGSMGVYDIFIIMGLVVVMLTLSYINRNSENLFEDHPEVDIKIWSSRQVYYYLTSWFVYLIGYEILFRGLLLISIAPIVGFETALALHVVIYTLAHLDKAPEAVIASLAFGAVLGYYSLEVGSIYPALIAHVAFSLRSSIYSIVNNPEIEWKR